MGGSRVCMQRTGMEWWRRYEPWYGWLTDCCGEGGVGLFDTSDRSGLSYC